MSEERMKVKPANLKPPPAPPSYNPSFILKHHANVRGLDEANYFAARKPRHALTFKKLLSCVVNSPWTQGNPHTG